MEGEVDWLRWWWRDRIVGLREGRMLVRRCAIPSFLLVSWGVGDGGEFLAGELRFERLP